MGSENDFAPGGNRLMPRKTDGSDDPPLRWTAPTAASTEAPRRDGGRRPIAEQLGLAERARQVSAPRRRVRQLSASARRRSGRTPARARRRSRSSSSSRRSTTSRASRTSIPRRPMPRRSCRASTWSRRSCSRRSARPASRSSIPSARRSIPRCTRRWRPSRRRPREDDHVVSRVYQPGYMFKSQLLRPARVVVKQWNG